MTQIDFYPAAMVGHFNRITNHPERKHFTFWRDDAPFKYDKLLYSFYYLQDRYKKLKPGESYFKSIGYDGKLCLDSGGFQVKTMGVHIEPEDVLKVYEREHPTIGLVLDIPIDDGWSNISIKRTLKNVDYMVENKHRIPYTELLNVLHGYTIQERRKYYDIFKKFNNYLDGWSAGLIKRLSPIFNAWNFMFLLEKDPSLKDKRFHFLGLTGDKNMAVIYYLGKLDLVKHISFDSTKYGREAIMGEMRNPSFMGERLSLSRNAISEFSSNKFCPCPVCQTFTMEEMKNDVNPCILHNLFWEIKKFEFFDSFKTAEDLKNYIFDSGLFKEPTKIAIRFIDYCLEHGIDKAEEAFAHYLIPKDPPEPKQEHTWW